MHRDASFDQVSLRNEQDQMITVSVMASLRQADRGAFFRGLTPAMALTVLVGLLVTGTLVPAIPVSRLLWPYDSRRSPTRTADQVSSTPPRRSA